MRNLVDEALAFRRPTAQPGHVGFRPGLVDEHQSPGIESPIFGILKRGGKVHTVMIPDVRKDTLLPIIRQKVVPDSIVYTDSYPAYDVLDVSEFHHHRIDHSDAYVLDRHNHINGIENFWNQAKRTLSRYNGIPKAHFPLFLKETEFRFNYGKPNRNCELSNAGPNSSLSQPIWDSPKKKSFPLLSSVWNAAPVLNRATKRAIGPTAIGKSIA